ncbi:hypothetical protein PZB74_11030 [Porifericola rhodea]|uniref:hypothetical protein n=1 Tax=Porifericola rhodea TaxID=930972 RepID=UPI002666B7D5|nr:hypothetical protein [Porifericola rhodea]WKN33857.1 hypothetical protein PZB74_11030 [Porifericola rhodea]
MRLNKDSNILEAADLVLSGMSREESLRQQLAAYGISEEKRQVLSSLYEEARTRLSAQQKCYDEQWSLSQQLKAQMEATQSRFKEHARVVRAAYRNEVDTLHLLKINRFERDGWPCINQAAYFYSRVQEQDINLQPYGVSRKELEQSRSAVKTLLGMKKDRSWQKAKAEHCTQEKNAAMKALREWLVEFRTIARLACKHNPQMLEMFGIRVLTTA